MRIPELWIGSLLGRPIGTTALQPFKTRERTTCKANAKSGQRSLESVQQKVA